MRKGLQLLAAAAVLFLSLTVWTVPALAQKEAPESTEETTAQDSPEPTGEAFSGETDLITKDLMYDKEGRKQFISVQDRDGNLFYIIIDYDAPVNEAEEQYKTYFLNPVDPEDLAGLTGQEENRPAACICTEKCKPGKVNMACPVCSVNMGECAGTEPTVQEEEPTPEASTPVEPETKLETKQALSALAGLLILLGGGIAFFILKFRKKKTADSSQVDPDDEDFEEERDNPEVPDNPAPVQKTDHSDAADDQAPGQVETPKPQNPA